MGFLLLFDFFFCLELYIAAAVVIVDELLKCFFLIQEPFDSVAPSESSPKNVVKK